MHTITYSLNRVQTKFLVERVAFLVSVESPFETRVVAGAGPPGHMYSVFKMLVNIELQAVPCEGPGCKSREDRGVFGGQTATRSGRAVALPCHVARCQSLKRLQTM